MYEILLYKKAQKFLEKQDKKIKELLGKNIRALKENPFIGKPLSGNLKGLRSLRVNKYRILYQKEEEKLIVLVLDVGHGKNIY